MGNVAKYQHGWNMTFTVVELLMIIPKSTYLSISLPYFSIYHFFSLTLLDKYKKADERQIVSYRYSKFREPSERRVSLRGQNEINLSTCHDGTLLFFKSSSSVLGRVCSFQHLKPIFRENESYFKGLPWKNWRKHGCNILFYTWT